jgi:hypothetical protein
VNGWSSLGIVVGAAAAVLLAALLVAVAVRPAGLPGNRAVHTLALLAAVLVAGILLTVTRQPPAALGTELLLLGVLTGTLAVLVDRRTPRDGILDLGTPNLVVAALIAAAGISLLAGEEGGLYLLVAAVTGALLGAVGHAWLMLSAVPPARSALEPAYGRGDGGTAAPDPAQPTPPTTG